MPISNDFVSRITVHPEGYDTSRFASVANLTTALAEKPDLLRPSITKLMGDWNMSSKRFPLLNMLEAGNRISKAEISGHQFKYPVIGRRKVTEQVAGSAYSASDVIGANSEINIEFKSDWFIYSTQIKSPSGVICRVQAEPIRRGTNRYAYRLFAVTPGATLTYRDVLPGATWGVVGPGIVSVANSIGNYGHSQHPGMRRGVINTVRKSYSLAGNIANKVVEFVLADANGNSTNYWLSWYEFQNMLEFKEDCHSNLFLSEYSYLADGSNNLFDDYSNDFVPSGAGLKQQITQSVPYTTLTEEFLNNIISSVFRGKADEGLGSNIVCFCGNGFKEEFHKAMIQANIFQLVAANTSMEFLKRVKGELMLGDYVTMYKHTDGHTISLVQLPFLEDSGYANSCPIHYQTARPSSSYEAYLVDAGSYDGQSNIQLLSEKGRGEIRGLELGMAVPTGLSALNYRGNGEYLQLATSTDRTSVHFMRTQGVIMYNDRYSVKFLPDMTNFRF